MREKSANQTRLRSISALVVMLSTLISRILGYVKSAVIAHYFGAGGVADVLNGVFLIPNNLRKLMAEGALTTAFIPALSKHVVREDHRAARKITQEVLTLQYVVLLPFILISILSAPQMASFLFNFPEASQMELASKLYAWFIPYLLFVSVAAIITAVLNTHGRFLMGALSPLFFSFAVIMAVVGFSGSLGVYSMALGILVGGLGQVMILYPLFRRLDYRLSPSLFLRSEEFNTIMKRYLPALLSSSIFVINQLVASRLASGLADGSMSALTNSIVFFNLPLGIFSATVNTVFYPQLAKAAHAQNHQELAETMKRGLYLLLIFLAPSALLMGVLAHEIISVALMRGMFGQEAVMLTAQVLIGYLVGIFFIAAYNFAQRYFYAKGRFFLPLMSAIFASGLDIILSLWLIRTPLGVSGLAYANSIAFFFGFLLLFIIIVKEQGLSVYKDSLGLMFKVAISLGVGYGIYLLTERLLAPDWWRAPLPFLQKLSYLFLQGGLPALAILGMYILFKMDMIKDIFRLRKKRGSK